MTIGNLNELLEDIQKVHIGILGDFCVDIYWLADMTQSELSKETPHFPLPIMEERVAPGAAGNVAANLAALRPASLHCLGIKGDDWRGMLLEEALSQKGIDASLIVCPERWTSAYCKPLRKGISDVIYEDPRLDFVSPNPPSKETEEQILLLLEHLSSSMDVLAVADQFENGIVTPAVRDKLSSLAQDGLKIIADSRYHIAEYRNVILKPNESECQAACGKNSSLSAEENARELASKCYATVIETLGSQGAIITDGSYLRNIPAVTIDGPLDICGAGDSFLSAFALAVGTGCNLLRCAEFASLASAVTIQKIGETGTATAEEIRALFCEKF